MLRKRASIPALKGKCILHHFSQHNEKQVLLILNASTQLPLGAQTARTYFREKALHLSSV